MRVRLSWMALLLATACSGGDEHVAPDPAYAVVLSGAPQADTIDALLREPLVARFTRDSLPAADLPVRIRVAGCPSQCPTVALETGGFHPALTVSTDSVGEVHLRVRLGRVRGSALVIAEMVDASVSDTGTVQVVSGAPDTLLLGTSLDTGLVIHSRMALEARVADRGGNTLLVPVQTIVDQDYLRVSGDTLTAVDYGLAFVTVSASSGLRHWEARGYVAVVPPGRLVLSSYAGNVEIANTDGSARRVLGAAGTTGGGWSPDGNRVAYSGSGAQLLVQRDLAQGELVLTASTVGPLAEMTAPSYSRAGDWIYFAGWPKRDNSDGNQASWEVWRIHSDGRGLERIGQPGLNADADFAPTPAPDGNRVAWVTSRGGAPEVHQLAIHDVSSGITAVVPGAIGYWPSWSPVADSIAYLRADAGGNLSLYLIAVTGGTPRNVVPSYGYFRYTQMGWSPDGNWMVATTWEDPMSVVLVRMSDGLMIRLPWVKGLVTGSSWAAAMLP